MGLVVVDRTNKYRKYFCTVVSIVLGTKDQYVLYRILCKNIFKRVFFFHQGLCGFEKGVAGDFIASV